MRSEAYQSAYREGFEDGRNDDKQPLPAKVHADIRAGYLDGIEAGTQERLSVDGQLDRLVSRIHGRRVA